MNHKKITIDSYDQNAKEFSEKFKKLMDIGLRKEFSDFLKLLKGDKVLDLGCGAGDHSVYFKEQGLDLTAIDLSTSMIDLCKEKGLNAYVMDIEDLKFQEKTFDGIRATTSLLHIEKSRIQKVIEKLNEILKTNGILYICVKEGDGEKIIEDNNGKNKRFFSFWRESELKDILDPYFNFIESSKTKTNNNIFLKMFFRKK